MKHTVSHQTVPMAVKPFRFLLRILDHEWVLVAFRG